MAGQTLDAPAAAPLIDCHAHIWCDDMPVVSTAWTRPDFVYTAEDFLSDLAAHGVQFGVIAAASLFGTYNDYSIRAVRRHKRLRATVNVEPDVDFYTLEAMRADGIVGIRLQWFFKPELPDITSDGYQLLFRRLRDLDMHIHLNIEGERLIEAAAQIMDSGVRLVIDHFGWHDPKLRLAAPSYQGMLRLLDRGNAWVKISDGLVRPDRDLPAEYTQDLLARFGVEKLLWGSDAPFVGHEGSYRYYDTIDLLNYCMPDAQTRQALGENGYRFYFDN